MPNHTFLTPNSPERAPHSASAALIVDEAARCARVNGREVELTALEFDLLRYCARHAGRVLSVAELLREVWGCAPGAGGTPEMVRSCVSRLRRKLEPEGRRARGSVLKCVSRYGYRLATGQARVWPRQW